MIGTQVGSYRILEKLGEGGMGVVYKALDTTLDRVVALKSLSTELAHNPELEQRFRLEARAQANLNHTNIATLYAFLIEQGCAWMVMEYVEGESFAQMVHRRGPIPSQEAIPLFKQALLGIGHAHRMGIVHRDIKPSNLMLNRQGIVKVMDFGIAKALGNRGITRTGTQMGTAFYMSPEQVVNRGVDIRSDIYSLGVTLYEMLTANVPFSGDSDFQVMSDHVHTPPPLLTRFYPYVPKGAERAVLKALEKDPDARFQTVEEFGAALEQPESLAAPVPVETPDETVAEREPAPVPVSPRPAFWTKPRIRIAGGAALAVLLLIGGLALWHKLRRPVTVVTAPVTSAANSPSQPKGVIEIPPPPPLPGLETKSVAQETPQKPPRGEPAKQKELEKKAPEKVEPKRGPDTAGAVTPRPAPAVAQVTIPAGTVVTVRTIDLVDSSVNRKGEQFAASVDEPVVIGARTVVPKGAKAELRLSSVSQAGRIEGHSEVVLELVAIAAGGHHYAVNSDYFTQAGASRGKRSAQVIGGATAVGAAIGGIFRKKNRGAGAAEGAAIGAGAGTGVQVATKGQAVVIAPETRINFTLQKALVVTAAE